MAYKWDFGLIFSYANFWAKGLGITLAYSVGTVAGFVGLGGTLGGVVLGQLAGWLLDHGYSYTPVLAVAGSLHVAAFLVILATVRSLGPLPLAPPIHAAP